MTNGCLLLFLAYLAIAESQNANFTVLPSSQVVVEGDNATFECAASSNDGTQSYNISWRLRRGSEVIITISSSRAVSGTGGAVVGTNNRSPLVLTSVMRSLNGITVSCIAVINTATTMEQTEPPATLTLAYPPEYTLDNTLSTTVTEGTSVYTYQFRLDAGPIPTDFNWTKDSQVVASDNRITLSVDSITIRNITRDVSGTYIVTSRNGAGMDMANFTLDVQYPPSINVDESPQSLMTGDSFILNCTPDPGNPQPTAALFYFNGSQLNVSDPRISGFVLTISSIKREERGVYSCTVHNTVGNVTAEVNVSVLAPPTVPRDLDFSNISSFSSTVSWSPPEDNGGDPNPLTYRINVTNDTVTMMYNTSGLELQLTNLWHSRSYNVSVVVVNRYGTSPPAEMVLTTPDSVPIIDKVSVKALNLSRVLVNITLLTDGGQRVMYYEVEIDGSKKQYTSSDTEVSFFADEFTLSNSVFYNATIVANNSVGLSEPFNYEFFVPNPPNITMAPTSLDPSAIQTCCAGVKLNLEDPDDPTLVVKVYRNGVLHPNTSREDDNLFIPGLQAGREYTFRVTVKNVFGTSERNVTVTPVLGRPSNPARPSVTSDGTTVTVVLSTDYPGTERMRGGSNFTFHLQFTTVGRSTRQSDTQVVSVTPSGLSSPVTTTYQGVLSGGSYTVRVTAVNEHGSSESVVSEEFDVTEPTQPLPTADSTPVIVGVVIGVVVAILLVIIIIFVGVILYMKFWKNKGHYLMKKGSDTPSNYATNGGNNEKGEIEMISNQPAVLYAAVDNSKMSQKEKEVADGQYDDPDITKPPATEGLVYADLEFSKKTTDYKKPPPKAEETVIYSEVTLQQQPPPGGSDRDERTHSPTTIM